jgi:hypothetical protein
MFVKASWIAIVAALCVAQIHAAQAAKPANAAIGTSTLIHDASGKAIGSAANWYDKNGTFISSETTYFSNAPVAAPPVSAAPAAAPAVAAEANKSVNPPTTYAYATSTAINDANGKPIGESAKYMDKDGKEIFSKTTYYSNAPAAAPAIVREADTDTPGTVKASK